MEIDDELKREGRILFDGEILNEMLKPCPEYRGLQSQVPISVLAWQVLENERKRPGAFRGTRTFRGTLRPHSPSNYRATGR